MTKLTVEQVKFNLVKVPGWKLNEEQNALIQTFSCHSFTTAMAFVNRVASYLDHDVDHEHAEIRIGSNWVTFVLSSKQARGLTGKDFAIAQAISKLAP